MNYSHMHDHYMENHIKYLNQTAYKHVNPQYNQPKINMLYHAKCAFSNLKQQPLLQVKNDNMINIIFIYQGYDGIFNRIKPCSQMSKLMEKCCERLGISNKNFV